jgi:hypothetical protein
MVTARTPIAVVFGVRDDNPPRGDCVVSFGPRFMTTPARLLLPPVERKWPLTVVLPSSGLSFSAIGPG